MDEKKKRPPIRTDRQNRALHLWLALLATELNAAGYTVKLVLEKKMDMDWTPEMVKELLWRPAQKAITRKHSTTKLNKTQEIDLIRDHLIRHLGEHFGLELPPFPAFLPGEYEAHTSSVDNENGKSR